MEILKDYGHGLHETVFQKALQVCNPDLHFDVASRMGWHHLKQSKWQGVWLGERLVAAMGRGLMPEFDLWAARNGKRAFIELIGWRDCTERIIRQEVPGVTWEKMCALLHVPRLYYTGPKETLDIGLKSGFEFIS